MKTSVGMLLKLKAFIATVRRAGLLPKPSQLLVSPPIIMKTVEELEWDFKATLFVRSTGRLMYEDS